MDERTIARVYVRENTADRAVISLPGTNYLLHLKPMGEITPSPQGRVRGTIRCKAWKMEPVSAGGAYIQPLYGRPNRVQGEVTATFAETNSVVIEIRQTPVVVDLPDRWDAAEIALGARIGMDVYKGATFEPVAGKVGV